MPTWNPEQYLKFADHRLRPALDLVARVPDRDPRVIWDLGCGTGTPTALLRDRWPLADIHGLDSSADMLDKVESIDRVDWVLGDIATWEPPQPVDMIFANASLHWLDDHAALFGRLIGFLAPRGTLAVQMPRNHGEPSHQILYETARSDRWSSRVAHLIRQAPVLPPTAYHEMVRPMSTELDVWETVYLQQMTGPDPVAAFTRGSAVRPFLDALGDDGDDFFADYSARLRPAYLAGDDGITLFSFRRVFIVATV